MNLNKSTLSEQIYQILRADILSQRIPLGAKLTLNSLKEQFGVSTTPVREALTRLTEEGLVNHYSNIGVNVISLTERDLTELYQFMGDLDRLAILYSAEYPEPERICRELEHVIAVTNAIESRDALLPEDIPKWIEHSDRFHLIFYDYCSNRRLKLAAEKMRSQLTIFSNIYETKTRPQKEINEMHSRICEAYKMRDYTKAGDLMKQHLEASLLYAKECLPE